ncbi:flocculation protein FLO11-like isoform X1 [Salvia splendens]|uniref:flocculation protein FLO11-like isoform X1 n=1 Tax=Salvia splendens TaxID=180675 RepID=UPI001C261249|nr:flocculation protein FLO11-like isoform X1 [Salvia splendens]
MCLFILFFYLLFVCVWFGFCVARFLILLFMHSGFLEFASSKLCLVVPCGLLITVLSSCTVFASWLFPSASVQFRPQNRDLGMVMREVDEDLAIFLGIQSVEMEKKNDHLLVEESLQFDDDFKCAETCLVGAADDFLSLEMEMRDHDWLLKQPDTSLNPSQDADAQVCVASQTNGSNGEVEIPLKSELDVTITASASESSSTLSSVECCTAVSRKPLSSSSVCRAATPTGRASGKSRPTRSSTPTTSRAALLPSSRPNAAQARSSTPVRPAPRSSTPASRPSLPVVSKSGTRSTPPACKPATPTTVSALDKSSSGKKISSTVLKSSLPSRGASPVVRSRPSRPSDALSSSQDADGNPKVSSMPKRPASAGRGSLSSNTSSSSNEKPRQKSCSPASSAPRTGSSRVMSRSRGYNNGGDDVNPVVMGAKMVDRVVNMRKLAPPKQDEYVSQENPRKPSQENSGFGRSFSKKSLEMAMRHMEIRRSVPNNSQA